MYLRARKNEPAYKKKDIVGSYRYREEEYKGLSLEKYYYDVFRSKTICADMDTNIVSWFQKD